MVRTTNQIALAENESHPAATGLECGGIRHCPEVNNFKSSRLRFSFLVILIGLLCGCVHEHFTKGRGDVGQFILRKGIDLGGRPKSTNGLPIVQDRWQFVEDEFGVLVDIPVSQSLALETFLRSTFGAPSHETGNFTLWNVQDVGVAIYFERLTPDGKTSLSIHPQMSDEKRGRMFQKMTKTVEKNTRSWKK